MIMKTEQLNMISMKTIFLVYTVERSKQLETQDASSIQGLQHIQHSQPERKRTKPLQCNKVGSIIGLPLAFTTLLNCPPKILLSSEGTKLCVLVTADLFFGPTVSHSSSSAEETSDDFPPFKFEKNPSSLSNSSCI